MIDVNSGTIRSDVGLAECLKGLGSLILDLLIGMLEVLMQRFKQ